MLVSWYWRLRFKHTLCDLCTSPAVYTVRVGAGPRWWACAEHTDMMRTVATACVP